MVMNLVEICSLYGHSPQGILALVQPPKGLGYLPSIRTNHVIPLLPVKQVGFYQLYPPLQKPEPSTKLTATPIHPVGCLICPWGQSSANSLALPHWILMLSSDAAFSTAPFREGCILSHVFVSAQCGISIFLGPWGPDLATLIYSSVQPPPPTPITTRNCSSSPILTATTVLFSQLFLVVLHFLNLIKTSSSSLPLLLYLLEFKQVGFYQLPTYFRSIPQRLKVAREKQC